MCPIKQAEGEAGALNRNILLPPLRRRNLELHESLTEIDEQELAVLATDLAFTDTESAEHKGGETCAVPEVPVSSQKTKRISSCTSR
jgi:hypothetical protein